MENYRLMERLGKGGQGSVYLAEHKQGKRKYVLKKVRVNMDTSRSKQSISRSLGTAETGPCICVWLQEFFVMWDKEESSMFVCIVMDYYKKGDLREIIREYQEKKEPMPEDKIKKFLGEIIEALVFVHQRASIHRDLKPSNIFVKDDGALCLGDFGVSTVMGDLRTCPRNTVGTTMYMAPEVMTQAYDERSDVCR
ncbi:hypothetical protein BaRGS_00031383 [Batillaria attramentaria]|uniref:non-specific serine/threonine protein kinase n=1 Tax=Batillaria attramentaria TaxID=370345 RepID=A0ABD0JQN7_9CAEN